MYCDNEVVVSNSSLVESTLLKKHLSICYHKVRECYAKGVVCIAYEPTTTNMTDGCIKVLSVEEKHKQLH